MSAPACSDEPAGPALHESLDVVMKIYRTSNEEHEQRVAREAAEWVQAMKGEPSSADRSAFLSWIGGSQLHVQEVLLAGLVDRELGQPGALDGFDIDQVIADAGVHGNVVDLHPAAVAVASRHTASAPRATRVSGSRRPRARGLSRFGRWGQAAAMVAVLAIGATTWWSVRQPAAAHVYATAIAEQRVLTLEDGSVVTLAPRSSIAVRFSSGVRDIELTTGEADFKVAHDTARPFRVHAGESIIQAVGTRFTVNRLPSGTVVAVSEGKVRMMARPSLDYGIKALLGLDDADSTGLVGSKVAATSLTKPANLAAGNAVRIASSGRAFAPVVFADASNLQAATPRLTFHEDTVADIVTEFNRYNPRQIVVSDDSVRGQRYSGVFNANDADSFLQFLECCSDLSVARDGEQTRIVADSRKQRLE